MTTTRDLTTLKRESVDQMLATINAGHSPFPGTKVELPPDFDLEEAYRKGSVPVMVSYLPVLERFTVEGG